MCRRLRRRTVRNARVRPRDRQPAEGREIAAPAYRPAYAAASGRATGFRRQQAAVAAGPPVVAGPPIAADPSPSHQYSRRVAEAVTGRCAGRGRSADGSEPSDVDKSFCRAVSIGTDLSPAPVEKHTAERFVNLGEPAADTGEESLRLLVVHCPWVTSRLVRGGFPDISRHCPQVCPQPVHSWSACLHSARPVVHNHCGQLGFPGCREGRTLLLAA